MSERFDQRFTDYKNALKSLEDGLVIARDELHRDGIIQRFEFTYEMAWKVIKLWLATKDLFVGNAKDALQEALQNGLIADGNLWSSLHQSRNLTSHTYDSVTAEKVYESIKNDALPAFRELALQLERQKGNG